MFTAVCVNCLTLSHSNRVWDRIRSTYYTVKRVDEVVRHPHLVTQDHFTQVSKKVSGIAVKLIVCKCRTSSTELEFFKSSIAWARTCNLHIHNLLLYHCATLSSLFKSTLKESRNNWRRSVSLFEAFIVTVELFRQWKYRIKEFLVTVELFWQWHGMP
jgi:hypothetical protein